MIHRSSFVAASIALAASCIVSAADEPSGTEAAKADIKAGQIKYMLYGQPRASDGLFGEVLKKDHAITLVIVANCMVEKEVRQRADEYNAEVARHLATIGQASVIKDAEKKARLLFEEQAAKKRADLAARIGDFSKSTVALAELAQLIRGDDPTRPEFKAFVEPLFERSGWGGISRRESKWAEDLLVQTGQQAVPFLRQKLGSTEAHDRRVAAEVLVRIGPLSAELASLLVPLLDDKDMFVRRAAIDGLGAIGPKARHVIGRVEQAATSDPDEFRRAVARVALIKIDGSTEQRIRDLAVFLFSAEEEGNCSYAARSLGELGPLARFLEPELLPLLKREKAKFAIVELLGQVGANSPETIAGVTLILQKDAHPGLRRTAAAALGNIGGAAKSAVPSLTEALKGDGEGGWWVAAIALGKIGTPEVVPVLIKALSNPDEDIRRAAMRALGDMGDDAKTAIPLLKKAAKEEEKDYTRKAAAEALKKLEEKHD